MGDHSSHKAVKNRLSRATGHLKSVITMIEEEKPCSDVLVQLSAVISALNNTRQVFLEDHIKNCILKRGADADVDELMEELREYLRHLK